MAFLPTLDAAAVPPGIHSEIPVVQVPGRHGLLIDKPFAKRQVAQFLNQGAKDPHQTWEYSAIQRTGAAWQAPALAINLNPAWVTVAGRPQGGFQADVCPKQ